MLNLDPQKRAGRFTWLVIGTFAALAFLVSAALPAADDSAAESVGTSLPAAAAPAAAVAPTGATVDPKTALKSSPRPPRAPKPLPAARTALSLFAVLALILVAAFGASRWLKRLRIRPGGDRVLDVLDAIPLGPKRQVFVVSVYGRRLVIGAAGDQLCLLSEIDEEETGETPPATFDTRLERRIRPGATMLEAEA